MPTQISLNFIVIIDEWTPWRRYIQAETLLRLVLWNEALFEQELLRPCYLLAFKRSVRARRAIYAMHNSSLYNGSRAPYFALALGHLAVRS